MQPVRGRLYSLPANALVKSFCLSLTWNANILFSKRINRTSSHAYLYTSAERVGWLFVIVVGYFGVFQVDKIKGFVFFGFIKLILMVCKRSGL